MKKNYYNPEIEINVFDEENVVTASGENQIASVLNEAGVTAAYLTDVNVSAVEWTF